MLHDAQRTSAPSACNVSISTAVWIVICSEPAMRAPRSGCSGANSSRIAIKPGISVSAIAISLRPQSANPRSATLKSVKLFVWVTAFIGHSIVGDRAGEARTRSSPRARHGSTSAVARVGLPSLAAAHRPAAVAELLGKGQILPNRPGFVYGGRVGKGFPKHRDYRWLHFDWNDRPCRTTICSVDTEYSPRDAPERPTVGRPAARPPPPACAGRGARPPVPLVAMGCCRRRARRGGSGLLVLVGAFRRCACSAGTRKRRPLSARIARGCGARTKRQHRRLSQRAWHGNAS